MPEQEKSETPQPQENRGTLRLRQENAKTSYANMTLVTTTPEEVILNFGINTMPPNEQREINVEISDRIILNYPSAKRLAIALGNLIQRYEAARGVINLQPTPPAQQQQ
jgi:hypothetical protein